MEGGVREAPGCDVGRGGAATPEPLSNTSWFGRILLRDDSCEVEQRILATWFFSKPPLSSLPDGPGAGSIPYGI
jgi:hypothetical protein